MGKNMKNGSKKGNGCITFILGLFAISFALALYSIAWLPAIIAIIVFAVKKGENRKRNLLISSAIAITSFLVFLGLSSPSELTGLKATWNTTEYDITETAEITLSPIPDNAKIETLSLSNNPVASLKYEDGKALVSFKTEGSEELYFIANGKVKSNVQTIQVRDSEAEAARIAQEEDAEREAEKAEAKRIAQEKVEAARIAAEQAEAERVAAEQAEAARIAAEQAEAERIAAEQAEAERVAAEQAEAARIAAEQAEAARIAQEQAAQQQNTGQMVWISATGSKYHSIPNCGRMNPANAYQMSLSDAQANGYGRCSKCH